MYIDMLLTGFAVAVFDWFAVAVDCVAVAVDLVCC